VVQNKEVDVLKLEIKNSEAIENFINAQREINEFVEVEYRMIGTQQLPDFFVSTKGDRIKVVYTLLSPLRENENIKAVYEALDTFAYKGFLEDAFIGNVAEAATDAMPMHELELISKQLINFQEVPVDPIEVSEDMMARYVDAIQKILFTTKTEKSSHNVLAMQSKLLQCIYQFVLESGNGLLIRKGVQAAVGQLDSNLITDYDVAADIINSNPSRFGHFPFTGKDGVTYYFVYDKKDERYVDNSYKKTFIQSLNEIL